MISDENVTEHVAEKPGDKKSDKLNGSACP
jgi:hypothetical protein